MPSHLQRRRRRWYAILGIPQDVRRHFGGKRMLVQSLQTESLTEAERLKLPVIAGWKAAIEEARTGQPSRVKQDMIAQALQWRGELEAAKGGKGVLTAYDAETGEEWEQWSEYETLSGLLDDHVQDLERDDPEKGRTFAKVVKGETLPTTHHLEAWLGSLRNESKTLFEKRKAVEWFAEDFPFTHLVERAKIRTWAHRLDADKGLAPATIGKRLSALTGYWAYLQKIGAIPGEDEPFKGIVPKSRRKTKAQLADERQPFTPDEVLVLLRAAEAQANRLKRGHDLAALIQLAMWTGARIEELCLLRVEHIKGDRLRIEDAKTKAGQRDIPIHSRLKPLIHDLTAQSKDGFLLSGLDFNKHGDRSTAIGKRFGLLKKRLGFGPNHVFHSIRKTVATLLRDARVEEVIAADLLGHEIRTMSYGVYAGSVDPRVKREAIEKLAYEVPEQAQNAA